MVLLLERVDVEVFLVAVLSYSIYNARNKGFETSSNATRYEGSYLSCIPISSFSVYTDFLWTHHMKHHDNVYSNLCSLLQAACYDRIGRSMYAHRDEQYNFMPLADRNEIEKCNFGDQSASVSSK